MPCRHGVCVCELFKVIMHTLPTGLLQWRWRSILRGKHSAYKHTFLHGYANMPQTFLSQAHPFRQTLNVAAMPTWNLSRQHRRSWHLLWMPTRHHQSFRSHIMQPMPRRAHERSGAAQQRLRREHDKYLHCEYSVCVRRAGLQPHMRVCQSESVSPADCDFILPLITALPCGDLCGESRKCSLLPKVVSAVVSGRCQLHLYASHLPGLLGQEPA